jgi:hypothetical protein
MIPTTELRIAKLRSKLLVTMVCAYRIFPERAFHDTLFLQTSMTRIFHHSIHSRPNFRYRPTLRLSSNLMPGLIRG